MPLALAGARIFDGAPLLDGRAVVVDGGRIAAVVPSRPARPASTAKVEGLLAPGFIDVQVNGGGGVLFNDAPHASTASPRSAPPIAASARPASCRRSSPIRRDAHGGGDRRGPRGDRARRARACSASISKGRSSIRERKGVHDPAYMRADRGGRTRAADLARARPHARHPGARRRCRSRRSRRLQRGGRSRLRPATPRRLRHDRSRPRAQRALPASRTSSTPCRRSPAASPARSAPRSIDREAGAASSSTCHHVHDASLRVAHRRPRGRHASCW